jgi:hypothetical protein
VDNGELLICWSRRSSVAFEMGEEAELAGIDPDLSDFDYVVEDILDTRWGDPFEGTRCYLIKWQGFDETYNSQVHAIFKREQHSVY